MSKMKFGFVSLVGAGPGDPGLITLRGIECLTRADVVVYDRLANPMLLRMAPQAEWIPVGKQPNHHPIPQEEINTLLINQAGQGKRVVRLKGGDPYVFGRGGEEALALAEAGIPFDIVPGISSAVAVPAYAGIPVTHRDVACSTALITGHRANWVENPEADWQRCSLAADTLVFLMGVKNLPRIVGQLLKAGKSANTPVALIERGTTAHQKTVTGTLENIIDLSTNIRPPAVIVVGEVVSLRKCLQWYDSSEHRPLFGLRILNTKSISNLSDSGLIRGMPPVDEFDNQIFALGGDAIHLPTIEIVPLVNSETFQAAIDDLITRQKYNWVVFTSSNAVDALFEQITFLGYDARSLHGIQVAAVGKATEKALAARGILPDFLPEHSTGADLGKALPIQAGDQILLPRSEIALPDIPMKLRERGCSVNDVSAYTIRNAAPDKIVLRELSNEQIDVVSFFSPSGIQGMADMLTEAGIPDSIAEILSFPTVACIGPTTQKAAKEMGVHVDIVATEHTSAGLVKEIVRWRKHS